MARVLISTGASYGASLPGRNDPRVAATISKKTFQQIEDFIADNEGSIEKVQAGINLLAQGMVLVIKGYAQKSAAGPVSRTRRSNPALANRIPVQRITGRYFAGWTQKKLGNGHWLVYNDVFEAYLIEYGLYQKQRRPILKNSTISMLRFLDGTQTLARFADWVMQPRRRSSLGTFTSFRNPDQFKFALPFTAGDLAGRGANNPNIAGPTGQLP